MNYILNNKMKFEQNRYNKPVSPRTPIMLKNTPFINKVKVPLKLDTHIDTHINNISNYSLNSNILDFKLKNYQMKELISDKSIQIQSKPITPISTSISNTIKPIKSIEPYYNDELIINIYGYASINDKTLYNFLLELSFRFKIRIYICTYNLSTTAIEYYFQGLNVVSIIEPNLDLIDSFDSFDSSRNVFSSNIPLSNWKSMWSTMYYSINEIYKKEDDNTIILNTQFNINYTLNIDFIELRKTQFTKNIFLKDSTDLSGVDNPMIGDKNTLYKLIHTFYNHWV